MSEIEGYGVVFEFVVIVNSGVVVVVGFDLCGEILVLKK